jgi:chromosomal replication initiator protein
MLDEPREHTAPRIATSIRHLNGLHDVVYRKPEHVYALIEQLFGVDRCGLLSRRQDAKVVTARHWGMYMMKTQWGFSYPYIGKFFGGRDHTTVLYGVRKVMSDIATSADARRTEIDLMAALQRAEAADAS